jgi:hypothetical protein
MQTLEFKEVCGVLPAVLLARAQHIPEEAQVSVVVLKAQGEVTIVGATMVRVIGPLAEIVGDEWSSVAGAGEEPKNLLWPLEDVVFFVSVLFIVVVVECSAKSQPTWSVGISIGLYLFPVAHVPDHSFP